MSSRVIAKLGPELAGEMNETPVTRRPALTWIEPAAVPASVILVVCLLVPALLLVCVSFFKSSFAGIDGDASLPGLLAYLAAEEEYGQGLALAVPSEANSVKLR